MSILVCARRTLSTKDLVDRDHQSLFIARDESLYLFGLCPVLLRLRKRLRLEKIEALLPCSVKASSANVTATIRKHYPSIAETSSATDYLSAIMMTCSASQATPIKCSHLELSPGSHATPFNVIIFNFRVSSALDTFF